MTKYQELKELLRKATESQESRDRRAIETYTLALAEIQKALASDQDNFIDFVEDDEGAPIPFKPGNPLKCMRFDKDKREYFLNVRVVFQVGKRFTHIINRLSILEDDTDGLTLRLNDRHPVNVTGNQFDSLVNDFEGMVRDEIHKIATRQSGQGRVFVTGMNSVSAG
jgi:hypothetical protein